MSKFENYPIRYGSLIKPRNENQKPRYKFEISCNELEARAINYILNHKVGAPMRNCNRKTTISDVFIEALQQWKPMRQYWKPFYNIYEKRQKTRKIEMEQSKEELDTILNPNTSDHDGKEND